MEREEIRRIIEGAYVARMAGDAAALNALCTPDARFEVAGNTSLIAAYPPAAGLPMAEALAAILANVAMRDAVVADMLIDGNRAAVRLKASIAFGGLDWQDTEVWHLFEFDEAGKVRLVTEFLDTALLAREMTLHQQLQ